MIRALLAAVLLCACAPHLQRTAEDWRAITTTRDTWRELELPYERALCPLDSLDVLEVQDPLRFRQLCAANLPGDTTGGYRQAHSCYAYQHSIIAVAPGKAPDVREGLVVHETVHALQGCRRDRDRIDWFDGAHRIPELWHGPESVEQRARRRLREERGDGAR